MACTVAEALHEVIDFLLVLRKRTNEKPMGSDFKNEKPDGLKN